MGEHKLNLAPETVIRIKRRLAEIKTCTPKQPEMWRTPEESQARRLITWQGLKNRRAAIKNKEKDDV